MECPEIDLDEEEGYGFVISRAIASDGCPGRGSRVQKGQPSGMTLLLIRKAQPSSSSRAVSGQLAGAAGREKNKKQE